MCFLTNVEQERFVKIEIFTFLTFHNYYNINFDCFQLKQLQLHLSFHRKPSVILKNLKKQISLKNLQ